VYVCCCRILKGTSVPTDYGRLAFDDNGVRNQADFDVFNLVAEKSGIRRWKVGTHACCRRETSALIRLRERAYNNKWSKQFHVRLHRRRTWTVQSYSPGFATAHNHLIMSPWAHPSPHPKQHIDRFSRLCRAHDRDRQTDRQNDISSVHTTPSVTVGRVYVSTTAMRHNNSTRHNNSN